MKTALALSLLALLPAALAQDPAPAAPADSTPDSPPSQADLADHAALVQQIGEEAARGFDAEAHARALRMQIEALISRSGSTAAVSTSAGVPAVTSASSSTLPPAVAAPASTKPVPATVAAPVSPAPAPHSESRESVLRQVIQKLRAALDQAESELNSR